MNTHKLQTIAVVDTMAMFIVMSAMAIVLMAISVVWSFFLVIDLIILATYIAAVRGINDDGDALADDEEPSVIDNRKGADG